MGAAWCKNKAQAALEKVVQNRPSENTQKAAENHSNGNAGRDTVDVIDRPEVSSPVMKTPGVWQEVALEVPEQQPLNKTPVPPPRKKRQQMHRKIGMCRPPPPQPPIITTTSSPIVQKPRPKNVSTVSLPNYSELTPNKSQQKKNFLSPGRARKISSNSSISDATVERVEKYMRRCRSFGSIREQLAERLSSMDASSDSDDSWAGLDDWDLGVIEHETHTNDSPILPTSKLSKRPERRSTTTQPTIPELDGHELTSPSKTSQVVPSNSNEDFWYGKNWSSPVHDGLIPTEQRNGTIDTQQQLNGTKEDSNIKEVKRELQSIIYDFNRAKKISTSSMEVLPTQPVRNVKKKISVVSVTPPPSPEMSDVEDNSENAKIIESMVMNKAGEVDETTHSTLLRLLTECKNIEGALEHLGLQHIALDNSEIPGVHFSANKLQGITGHRKLLTEETSSVTSVCKSVDSGLDIRSNAEDKLVSRTENSQSKIPFSVSSDTLKSIDSGLNDFDDPTSPTKTTVSHVPNQSHFNTDFFLYSTDNQLSQTVSDQNSALKELELHLAKQKIDEPKSEETNEETESTSTNLLRKPKASYKEVTESGCSSGRSSMTPSLSELEAALSDMLEKSTEEDDSSLPVTSNNPFRSTSSAPVPSESNSSQDKTRPESSLLTNGVAVKLSNEVH